MAHGPKEPILDAAEIQGNVLPGFNTRGQRLVGLRIDDVEAARAWLGAVKIATLDTVAGIRAERRAHHERKEKKPFATPTTLINLTLSYHGLRRLMGGRTDAIVESWFKTGMWKVAGSLGDDQSKMGSWALGGSEETTPHILAILGNEDPGELDRSCGEFVDRARESGLITCYDQSGARIPIDEADHGKGFCEHFGFRDGISIPAVRGTLSENAEDHLYRRSTEASHYSATPAAKPGQALLWPGQVIFGYPAQDPDDPFAPAADAVGGPAWMRNGSFLVFRRLRQDVKAFRNFVAHQAARSEFQDWGPDRFSAMMVGRWPDGTPLATSPDASGKYDQLSGNNFSYATDLDGRRCPQIAHVRKVNPRDAPSDLGGEARALALQIFRRGIPWGEPYTEGAKDQRGLLFLAYTTAIEERFGRLSSVWMNRPDGPEHGRRGLDLLVGQHEHRGPRRGRLRSGDDDVEVSTRDNWVIPTGGGFFFSPSVSLLAQGCDPGADASRSAR